MAGTITVVNRFTPKAHPDVVRKMITRSASPVGNPFVIGEHGDREKCCNLFERHVWSKEIWVKEWGKEAQEWLHNITWEYMCGKDIELVCSCKPKRCHGDTLKDLIIWYAGRWDWELVEEVDDAS